MLCSRHIPVCPTNLFFIFTVQVGLLIPGPSLGPSLLGLFFQTGFPPKLLSAFPIHAHFASVFTLRIPAQLVPLFAHTPVFSYPAQAWMFIWQPWAVARGRCTTPDSSNQYTPWLQPMKEMLQGKLNFTTNSFFKKNRVFSTCAREFVHSSHTWAMKWQFKRHFFIDI